MSIDEYESRYVDIDSPDFYASIQNSDEFKNYRYTEENLKEMEAQGNPCTTKHEFKLQRYQNFIREFMKADTPYRSILLFWGVGTGKTCGAIQIAEALKDHVKSFGPTKQIYVIASDSLLKQFELQLFDESKINIDTMINASNQPDSTSYMQIPDFKGLTGCTGNEYFIDPKIVPEAILRQKLRERKIRSFYSFHTYGGFKKIINKTLELGEQELKNKFSNCVFIIDEAHNLNSQEALSLDEDNDSMFSQDTIYNIVETTRQAFEKLFSTIVNSKLILLSGTPIRDNVDTELVTLINLLRSNDGRDTISAEDIRVNGKLNTELITEKVKGYISYVKGENRLSFPRVIYRGEKMPMLQYDVKGDIIHTELTTLAEQCEMSVEQSAFYLLFEMQRFTNRLALSEKTKNRYEALCNYIFPYDMETSTAKLDEDVTRKFGSTQYNTFIQYMVQDQIRIATLKYPFLDQSNLSKYSSKISRLLENITKYMGTHYVFSDKIQDALDLIAIALNYYGFKMIMIGSTPEYISHEFNGKNVFTLRGNNVKYYDTVNEVSGSLPKRCYCGVLKEDHASITDHEFIQGCFAYHIGTGKYKQYSEFNRKAFISKYNIDGHIIRVFIGSRVSSEGIDYKNISSVHIFTMWYNVTRIEQVIGRGSRNCSHANPSKSTVNVFYYNAILNKDIAAIKKLLPDNYKGLADEYAKRETVDQNIYRFAEEKYRETAEIYRIFKVAAVDCVNNYEWNKIPAEGSSEFSINYPEKDYSAKCDFTTCKYKCLTEGKYKSKPVSELASYLTINNIMQEHYVYEILQFIKNLKIPKFDLETLLKFMNLGNKEQRTTQYNSLLAALDSIINDDKYIFYWNNVRGKMIYDNDTKIYSFNPTSIPYRIQLNNEERKIPDFYKLNYVFSTGPSSIHVKNVSTTTPLIQETNIMLNMSDIQNIVIGLLEQSKQKDNEYLLFKSFDTLHKNKYLYSGLTTFDYVYESVLEHMSEKEYKTLYKIIQKYMVLNYRCQPDSTEFYISTVSISKMPSNTVRNIKTFRHYNYEYSIICRLFCNPNLTFQSTESIEIPFDIAVSKFIKTQNTMYKTNDKHWCTVLVHFTRYAKNILYSSEDILNSFDITKTTGDQTNIMMQPVPGTKQNLGIEILPNIKNNVEYTVSNNSKTSLETYIINSIQWTFNTFFKTGIRNDLKVADNIYGYYVVETKDSKPIDNTKIVDQVSNEGKKNLRERSTGRVCETTTSHILKKYTETLKARLKDSGIDSTDLNDIDTTLDVKNLCSRIEEALRKLDIIHRHKNLLRTYFYYGDYDLNTYIPINSKANIAYTNLDEDNNDDEE